MKTTISTLTIAIIPIIVLTIVVIFSTPLAKKVEQSRMAAIQTVQPGPEMLAGSYSTMLNTLYATSGR